MAGIMTQRVHLDGEPEGNSLNVDPRAGAGGEQPEVSSPEYPNERREKTKCANQRPFVSVGMATAN